jgi:hypothetical protein
MRRLAAFALTLIVASTSVAACSSQPAQSEEQNVSARGALAFGEPVDGEFAADFEYHAYTFEVRAGSRVSLEITQAGTAAALDTVMVLYGPPDANGDRERLAVDHDSGWGGHSKLAEQTLVDAGRYTVTVGTADGLGRGKYRLGLSCDAGTCTSQATPLELSEGEPNTEFMETFNIYDDAPWAEYCYRNGRAFSYSDGIEGADLLQAGAAIVGLYTQELELDEDAISYGGEITLPQFDEWLKMGGLDIGTFEGAIGVFDGDSYRVGEVLYEYECAPSVTCSGTVMTAHFPSRHEVWTVEFGCGDE